MTRLVDRQKAIALRQQGKTYSEIKAMLQISKSTLSDWLSSYPLTEKQITFLKKHIQKNKQTSIEKTIITKRIKRQKRLQDTYNKQKKHYVPLSQKQLEIAGLCLYWGEGNKSPQGSVSINNTDPHVVIFSLYWLIYALNVPKHKIKVQLHLYTDMNINQETIYWSKKLQIPLSQFYKPYIKVSTRSGIDQKGFGHDTCGLVVHDIQLKEKILMGIKALADFSTKQIEAMI